MFPEAKVVLVLCLLKQLHLADSIADPTITCKRFVPEGDPLTCECEVRDVGDHPADFSLAWPGRSTTPTLDIPTVKRQHNGTTYICLLVWNGEKRTASYTLQVAYGPDDAHTAIEGPDPFVTDGSRTMTLTCKATDVNPNPVYTWETDRCVTYDVDRGTCSLVPQVPWDDGTQVKCSARSREGNSNKATAAFRINIVFPPSNPPVIKGYRPGNIVYFQEPLECSVQGGKPLVSEVTMSCNRTGVIYLGGTTVGGGGSFARRNFTFNTGIKGTTLVSCTCGGEWAPETNLYQRTSDIVFHVKSPPQNPVINCSTLIPEGESGTCECRLAPGDDLPDGYSLTWPGHSNSQVMQMRNVQRLDNGRTFTCLLSYDGLVLSTTYTLQVAYGPEEEHMRIVGPDKFITDGTMKLTLTCNATEVNPSPSYTWSLDRCEVREMDGKSTCSFVPRPLFDDGLVIQCIATNIRTQKKAASNISLDFQYPPLYPPIIDGVIEDQGLIAGTILFCNVSGGKPLVSKVIFTCQEPPLDDEEDFVDGETVSSPLTINVTLTSTDAMRCTCHAVWSPRPELYTMVHEFGGFEIKQSSYGMMFIILVSAASATVVFVILIFVAGICCWRRRRATNKGREEKESKQTASLQENDIDKKTGKNGRKEKESEESVSLHKNVIDEKTGEQNENDSLITPREAKTETSI